MSMIDYSIQYQNDDSTVAGLDHDGCSYKMDQLRSVRGFVLQK